MTSMVEKGATAILAKVPAGYGMTKAEAADYARAAIEAMKEPTPAMLVAYTSACSDVDGPAAMNLNERAYAAMLDFALSEESTS